ncbi:MAG: HAD family phosphatase [Marinilabiliaceae bacterium]|nr:HAD family phosphatase [Marinilabiliaceae bacterium]
MNCKNNKLLAVFFDMDGVLYDSMKNHAISWEKAMALYSINYPPYYSYINEGRTGRNTINWAFNEKFNRDAMDNEIKNIYTAKTTFMQQLPKPEIMQGMQKFIQSLKNNNIKIGVVTGSNQKSLIDRIVIDFSINRNSIISGGDVKKGKPDPEPYLTALKRFNLKSENVIIIENAPLGIKSAKSANAFTIAVNTGVLENKVLKESGADLVYNSCTEMITNWPIICNQFK